MSHMESNIEQSVVATDYSSGDSKKMKSKSKQLYPEENNNEVDELSQELQMGCIVDAVKRPPNICVETYVYEESDSEASNHYAQEDVYSDEFEEDKSECDESLQSSSIPKSHKSEMISPNRRQVLPQESRHSSLNLSKSQSFMSMKQNGSLSGSKVFSFGSVSVPQTRRINMSFSNDRLREIERHNHILLNKILTARNHTKSSIPPAAAGASAEPKRPVPSAAVRRKKQQRQIDRDNMILLRKIQQTKSSMCSIRR